MKRVHKLLLATTLIFGFSATALIVHAARHPDLHLRLGGSVLELAQDRRAGELLEAPERGPRGPRGSGSRQLRRLEREVVEVFGDSLVDPDESVSRVITVFGDTTIEGEVREDVVVVFGTAVIEGQIDGQLTVVMGGANLSETARVERGAVVVGGQLNEADGSYIGGRVHAHSLGNVGPRVSQWCRSGLLMLRPFPPGFGIAWTLVLMHFLIYLVLAVVLPKPVNACVAELRLRLGPCFLVGLLGFVLSVPLTIALVATGVGLILIPFLLLLLTGAVFLGKAATLQHIGEQVALRFGAKQLPVPLLALCVGGLLVSLVYMVPLLGLVAWGVLLPIAIGAVLLALAESFRHSSQPAGGPTPPELSESVEVPVPSATPVPSAPAVPLEAPEPKTSSKAKAARKGRKSEPAEPPSSSESPSLDWTPGACCPGAASASSFSAAELAVMPRVGFWMRLMASFLDFVLLLWVLPVAHRWFVPVWLLYHVGMWIWKGTTVGGIVCGLKVIRVDGGPLDFGVALVRALGSVFSFMALGIGFFWAGWMPERQSWHDRIAGTVIVKLPKGVSLV